MINNLMNDLEDEIRRKLEGTRYQAETRERCKERLKYARLKHIML